MSDSLSPRLPVPDLRERLQVLETAMYRVPEDSQETLQQLLDEARRVGDEWAQAFALILLSGCSFYVGEPRQAILRAAEGLDVARRANIPELECRLMNGLGLAHHRLGEYDQAFEAFLRTLRLAQVLGDRANCFRALNNLASLYTDTGNLRLALQTMEEALDLADGLPATFLAGGMTYMINIRTQLGDDDLALALAEEYLPLIREHGPARWWGTVQQCVAQALLNLGQPGASLQAAQQGLQDARQQQDYESICAMTLAAARALISLRRWTEAEPLLGQGLSLSREKGNRPLEARALGFLAALHEEQGYYEQALALTRQHFALERQLHRREVESRSQLLTAQIRLELLQREAEIERLRNVELAQVNSALRATQQDLLYRATHDALTGVANRAHFEHRTQQALDALGVGDHLGLIFIDLDKFKHVNDTLGHHAGDLLLQEVVRRLEGVVRTTDLVGRVGGDEFTVLLPRLSSAHAAQVVAGKVLGALSAPFHIRGQAVPLTASVGCAVAPLDGQDAEVLQQHADLAMYRVKHSGGNQVLAFEPGMVDGAGQRRLERDLHGAHERGELHLYYQGRFALGRDTASHTAPHTAPDALVGFEALLRWHHPEQGLISPDVFIPLAEASRAIVPIGTWVLREACAQATRWDFPRRHLKMSVNVSPLQFEQPTFVQVVESALAAARLPAQALVLELTESLVMRDLELAQQHIRQLRALGVQVAIDDFGTGYSGLSVMQALTFDQLKVDRSFTRNLTAQATPTRRRARALLSAIIELAHSLEMTVTVEGIEDEAQRQLLVRLGCDHVQGFLLARPVPAGPAAALLP